METSAQAAAEQTVRVRKPDMYAVILFNDDITTMDFVVDILMKIFNKPAQEASRIMMDVHENGQGLAGIYTYDIAATKKMQATQMAAVKSFPLRLDVKPVTGNDPGGAL